MEETIKLKCDETGKIKITLQDKGSRIENFSTPNSNGINFGRLFADVKEGDIIELTFKNIRICSQCGKKLD